MFTVNIVVVVVFLLCNVVFVSALGSAEVGRAKFPLLLLLLYHHYQDIHTIIPYIFRRLGQPASCVKTEVGTSLMCLVSNSYLYCCVPRVRVRLSAEFVFGFDHNDVHR